MSDWLDVDDPEKMLVMTLERGVPEHRVLESDSKPG